MTALRRRVAPVRAGKRRRERGQILPMMAIALVAIVAVIAVAADMGYFFDYRRRMQTGADGAAMAGAEQLRRDANDAQVQPAAFSAAASNGFTNGASSTQVVIHHPPTSGPYAGNDRFVEAIISQTRPTIFMGILGINSASVGTRAVAGSLDSPNCIYALHPTANHALNTTGSAAVNAACGVVVDSSSSSALNSSGSAGVTATSIAVTGNTAGCCYSPTPTTGVPPEPDPLAGRAAPTVGGCDYINKSISSATAVLTSGVYCNGITISGGSSNVTFMPGTYILNGGGFSVSGGGTIRRAVSGCVSHGARARAPALARALHRHPRFWSSLLFGHRDLARRARRRTVRRSGQHQVRRLRRHAAGGLGCPGRCEQLHGDRVQVLPMRRWDGLL